jgi:hypothetical protein
MERRCPSHPLLFCLALAIATTSFFAGRAEAQPVRGEGQVVTPESSVVRTEDTGIRAHTNVRLIVPTGAPGNVAPPAPSGAAGPEELPPAPDSTMRIRPLHSLVYIGWLRDRTIAAIPMS